MKISDLRDWAAATFGAHSHKEGQVLAALGPLEEWLSHLARQGISLSLVPTELAAKLGDVGFKPLHSPDEPPTPVNSGGTAEVSDVPVMSVDPAGFVGATPLATPSDPITPAYAPSSPEAPADLPVPGSSANS